VTTTRWVGEMKYFGGPPSGEWSSNMRVRRISGYVTLAVAASVLLAGCGGGSSTESTESATDATASEEIATEDDGQSTTVTMAWGNVASQLDPSVFTGLADVYNMAQYCTTLVEYDAAVANDTKTFLPDDVTGNLAESWEADAAGTSYTFKLREGVVSSWGNPLTSEDVKWSFERMSAGSPIVAGILMPIANINQENSIEVIDELTFKMNLTEPSAVAIAVLTHPTMCILDAVKAQSEATAEDPWAAEWLGTNTASYGPYVVDSINPGQEIRYSAMPGYFGDPVFFQNAVVRFVPEGSNRTQLLLASEVDLITDTPFDKLAAIAESDNAKVLLRPDVNRHTLSLNTKDPQLADPRVRKAISLAVNRDAFLNTIYAGYADAAPDGLPSTMDFPSSDRPNSYDPEQAKALLAEAGAEGMTLQITTNNGRPGPFAEDLGRILVADLQAVGINATLNPIASEADFEKAVGEKSLQSWLYTERPAVADSGYIFNLYLGSTSFLNNTGFANEEFDGYVKTIVSTDPGAERDAAIAAAQNMVQDLVPAVYLTEASDIASSLNDIEGYNMYPHGATIIGELFRG
jgi:peptide/nickel transport system substrate-binding protein